MRKQHLGALFQLATLFLIALLIAGCGSTAPAANAPAAPEANAPAAPAGDSPAAASDSYEVVYIPKNTGNPYFDAVISGFEQASEDLGFTFTTVAPATADATSQIPFVKEQIQRGVDAIAISPNSADALNQVFKEAMDKGIKVIIVNSDIANAEFRHASIQPMDFSITGQSQVELMGELIDYEGEVAILSATTDAPDQNYWIEGMKETLQDPKYANMQLVEIAYGDDDPQKSLREAEALLVKYPNLRGIISPTTVGVAAAAQAVETAGVSDKVIVTGLGTPNQMRRFVENDIVSKFALWNPADQGLIAAYVIDGMMKGSLDPAPGVSFEVPTLGAREFGDKNVIIAGPPLVFDKNNIGDFDF